MLVINDFSNCVKVPVKNGVIYTETLTDYDELIGDISREGIIEFAELVKNLFADGDEVRAEIDELVKNCTGKTRPEFLLFTDRLKLEKMYHEWVKENELADKPNSVIAFLQIKGLVREGKAHEMLKEVDL